MACVLATAALSLVAPLPRLHAPLPHHAHAFRSRARAPVFDTATLSSPRRLHLASRLRAPAPIAQVDGVANLKAWFKQADADGGGTIDPEEFRTLMADSGLGLTPAQIDAILATVDSDGDGEISFEEFDSAFELGSAVTKDGLAATLRLKGACEVQRPFRRTVYGPDDWVAHRSSARFLRNFVTTFESGIVRSLKNEIRITTGIAVFVVLANGLLSGFTDFAGVVRKPLLALPFLKTLSLPLVPFNVLMPALSLLLVFRTNTAYSRWNEARTIWGGIINTCRNLQRQSNHFFPTGDRGDLLRFQLAQQVACFPKALRSFLRGAEDDPIFKKEALALLGPAKTDAIFASKNRPTFVANLISATVGRANLDPMDRAQMDQNTNKLVDQLGACERIFKSPIPLVYTRHTSRFLSMFVLLLPFTLWEAFSGSWNRWLTIPASTLVATFLFGIEELGIQIEEPFGILPIEAFADGSIEGVVMDMKQSHDLGHFGPPFDSDSEAMVASKLATDVSKLEAANFSDAENEVVSGYVVPTNTPGWIKEIINDDVKQDKVKKFLAAPPSAWATKEESEDE